MTPNILLIYTGGTIGMVADTSTGALQNLDFNYISAQIPEISLLNVIVTPKSISTPMDSSHMNPSIWVELCQMIEANHADYDGIVILHGTDTMAYTSSALSFMIQNLQKPIVFTGSQLPVHRLSDVLEMSEQEIIKITTDNASVLFQLATAVS